MRQLLSIGILSVRIERTYANVVAWPANEAPAISDRRLSMKSDVKIETPTESEELQSSRTTPDQKAYRRNYACSGHIH